MGCIKKNYKIYSPETVLSRSFFFEHTRDFYVYFKMHFLNDKIRPNKAHLWLARAESSSKVKVVIKQNINGLHQLAESKNVIELHGSVHRYYTVDKNHRLM